MSTKNLVSSNDNLGFVSLLLPAVILYLGLYTVFEVLASSATIMFTLTKFEALWSSLSMYSTFYFVFVAIFAFTLYRWKRGIHSGRLCWLMSLPRNHQIMLLLGTFLTAWFVPHTEIWYMNVQHSETFPVGWPPALVGLYGGEGRAPGWAVPGLFLAQWVSDIGEILANIHPALRGIAPWVCLHFYVYVPLCCAWLYWFDKGSFLRNQFRLIGAVLILFALSAVLTYSGSFLSVAEGFASIQGEVSQPLPENVFVNTDDLLIAGRLELLTNSWFGNWPSVPINAAIVIGGFLWYILLSSFVQWITKFRFKRDKASNTIPAPISQ